MVKVQVSLVFNPFASIGRTGTSKPKVKVVVICLNIIYDLIYQFFHSYMKKSSKSSLEKKDLIYLSSIKTELAISFLKNVCTWPKTGLALKGLIDVNPSVTLTTCFYCFFFFFFFNSVPKEKSEVFYL